MGKKNPDDSSNNNHKKLSSEKRELLMELLKQSNEHLRETDRKKNQTYYFFLILIGFYFSMYTKLSASSRGIITLVTLVLIIIGTILSIIIVNYQIWHSIYVNTAIILQKLMYKDISDLSKNNIKGIFQRRSKKYPFTGHGTEFYLYNSFLFIISSLLGLLIYNVSFFAGSVRVSTCCITMISISVICAYLCILNYIRKIKLQKAEEKFTELSWILDLVESEEE